MELTPNAAQREDVEASAASRDGVVPRHVARYVLTSADDVNGLLNAIPLLGLGFRSSVTILAPTLSTDAQHRWERRLGFWLNACGCQAGAYLALGALVWRSILVRQGLGLTWGTAMASFGWVLAAAIVGKLAGLAVARMLLLLDLKRLQRHLSGRSAIPCEARP